jgi:drug/metabolite transporter (DMT)-like permease
VKVITKNQTFSTICLFATAFIWGLAFVAQRVGADYMGSFTFNGVRFALGALSLIPVIVFFEKSSPSVNLKLTFLTGLVGGLVLFIASSLQQIGVVLTGSAGKAGFITGLYTVLVPVLGIFLHRRTTVLTWVGAFCAVVGLYLLSVPEGLSSIELGDITLLLGAIFWAIHIMFIDRFVDHIQPIRFAATQFAVCSILSLISAFLFETVVMQDILNGYLPILYGGLMSVGVAYTLQIIGQKGVPPARAAIIFSLEALFSAVGAAILLGETMRTKGYVGCAFIFAGIILSQLRLRPSC